MKCLLVDDLEENLLALSALLRAPGVEILKARSGREALELLLEHDVAVALVDVQMPEMDGFELAELMRGTERTRHVPIIFVTAGARDQQRMFQGYDLGAVDFLFKPIEPHALQSKVKVFFDLQRQRLQLREQMQTLSDTLRMNEMFIAILSHDLRNPLNAVLTGAEVLLRTSAEENTKKIADRIRASGQRMAGLVNDVLDMARSRIGGGIVLGKERLDLGELVQRLVAEHHREGGFKVSLTGDLHGEWDAGRLAQAISNLLGNAVQHGGTESPIEVTADGSALDSVTLSISNAGAIPASIQTRLFDPFRGRENRASPESGLGLGLYIVKQIALAHDGSVRLDSSDPDRTSFVVELPRKSVTPRAPRVIP
ncbi:MAG: hybrid sensor histidine kinase/response regulator [Myxococcales bacterium]|nr:MAG: hybrid sensor histidine kinase/response regulator [Myxococcales bacterium]